jgi:tellurite resistance protein
MARLEHLPVTLFSAVMGLGGLSLAWRRAAGLWELPQWPSQLAFWLALGVFVLVAGLYAVKWVRFPGAARAEVRHPVRMTFVPTISISVLLLATAGQDLLAGPATVAWWVGAVLHLVLTLLVVSAWFARPDISVAVVTPAWFIPVVGNVVTPLAAREVGDVELGWFAFGIGVVFWVALLPVLLHRVLLHDQALPERLLPTLAIFLAPPAVTLLSWQALTGQTDDAVSRVLLAATLAFTALLLAQAARLRRIPFALPYWAYSFPLAAATTATLAMADALGSAVYAVVGALLLAVTTVLVAVVSVLTVRAAVAGRICVPEQ